MQKKTNQKKAKQLYTHFWVGPWKRAGSSSTFFPQKKGVFKSSKTPFLWCFPKKWVAVIFQKGLSYKEETCRGGKTNDNFWGSFRQIFEEPPKIRTPQTGRLLNGAFGPSRIFPRHSLCACHIEAARRRHVPGEFVKTSATVAMSDLGSLFRPSLLPQSGTSLAFQHRWQTRGCKL